MKRWNLYLHHNHDARWMVVSGLKVKILKLPTLMNSGECNIFGVICLLLVISSFTVQEGAYEK